MRSFLLSASFLVFTFLPSLHSQSCHDVSVEFSVEVQDNPSNPSAGQFNISFEEGCALVRIFSSTGRLVFENIAR